MGAILGLLVLLSAGGFYAVTYFGKKYEETLPISIFIGIEIVFIFGLFDQLKLGVYALFAIAIILYILAIYRIVILKTWKATITNMVTPAFCIFIICSFVYAIAIMGRVAWRNDEFSFWAVSVKKMLYLDAFHCVPEAEPYFAEYPPGMQIFEYILQVLNGKFSEWHLNVSYMVYVFALFVPFLKGLKYKNIMKNVLISAMVFCVGTIIYSDALENLMVDFALGTTFAFGMALVYCPPSEDGKYDFFIFLNIAMVINMLVLIKSAGKFLAFIVFIAFAFSVIKEGQGKLWSKLKEEKKAVGLGGLISILPIMTAILWKVKYTHYQTHVAFEANYNIMEFVQILLGKNRETYRSMVKDNFISFLINERGEIGSFSMTNLQLSVLLIVLCLFIHFSYVQVDSFKHVISIKVMLLFLPIYWLGLMASYMYTFSEKEGVALASMQRYLNIYFSGILLMVIFLVLKRNSFYQSDVWKFYIMALCILCFVSWTDVNELLSGKAVEASIELRKPFSVLEEQIKADKKNAAQKETVLLIYRSGYPHTPVNQFSYLLWPEYIVPWECSYGSTLLFEGDGYTKIFTDIQFKEHLQELGVKYIAIGYVDQNFIDMYGHMFEQPLQSGQVFKVEEGVKVFKLM